MTQVISKDDNATESVVKLTKMKKKELARVSKNQWVVILQRLAKNRVAMLALYYIALNVFIAVFYPVLMGGSPSANYAVHDARLGGGANTFPNLKYPAGTDLRGMDSFARLLAGTETSLIVGVLSTIISLFIGILMGLMAGFYGGKIEEVIMRLTDLFLAVPFLILALILLRLNDLGQAGFLQSLTHVQVITLLIGVFGWAGLARLVTASVKQVKEMEYIQAIRILGATDRRILFIHIFPNVLAPIIVLGALFIAGGILGEAGLAFLGFGDSLNTISWGIQVNIATSQLRIHPEQSLVPGLAIFFLVLAVNLFGDALADAMNPRLKE